MHSLQRRCPCRFAALLLIVLLLSPPDVRAADDSASFTVDVKLGDVPTEQLQVTLNCFQDSQNVLNARITPGDSRSFAIPVPEQASLRCLLSALPIAGVRLQYRGDGGSEVELTPDGCLFNGVARGHANFCQIEIEQQRTELTVFKRWIGSASREPDVEIRLVCNGEQREEPLRINQDRPGGWELQVVDPEGLECDVFEVERDEFRADVSDCRGLIIRPGAQEECTLVNTKVVKMIQVLNRYGLFIMIGVFLVAGMIAARRMMP